MPGPCLRGEAVSREPTETLRSIGHMMLILKRQTDRDKLESMSRDIRLAVNLVIRASNGEYPRECAVCDGDGFTAGEVECGACFGVGLADVIALAMEDHG
jgi:hypothetical protein